MQQHNLRPCPECGGKRVGTSLEMGQRGGTLKNIHYLRLVQHTRKSSWFGGRSNTTELHALTCLACGYTSLYAIDVTNLVPDE